MSIDRVMLGAVRHYLIGMASVAWTLHSEMTYRKCDVDYPTREGRTLGDDIDMAKEQFLKSCREMLLDPVPEEYAHIDGYHLTSADRDFLTGLLERAKMANWRVHKEVEEIRSDIDRYALRVSFEN
jgi:hypothetical protein